MDESTRALLAECEASRLESAQILAELDAALAEWDRSIERLEIIAAEMRDVAAELEEWFY